MGNKSIQKKVSLKDCTLNRAFGINLRCFFNTKSNLWEEKKLDLYEKLGGAKLLEESKAD